jgi:hypothetical protein
MQPDGGQGVTADVRAGATVPGLGWVIAGLFAAGALLLAVGGLFVGLAVRSAQAPPPRSVPAGGGPAAPAGPAGSEPVLTGGPTH